MSNDSYQKSYELVHLMADYASRYGYLLGGLEMVAEGLATADAVLEAFRKKYETTETKPVKSEAEHPLRSSEPQAAEVNSALGVQYDNVEILDALRDVALMGDLSEEDRDVLYLAANVIEDLRDRLGEEK